MSVKAVGLVWDAECPKRYGDLIFKPSHKYVLTAYADHADHHGKNIWPSVPTIARKTGLDDRTVQRLTHDLEEMGFLIEDGTGPKGTNKWRLPYNDGGDKLTPVTNCRGDKFDDPLGDIPSGDIPSGDKLTPELKEPEPIYIEGETGSGIWEHVVEYLKGEFKGSSFNDHIRGVRATEFTGDLLRVEVPSEFSRDWLDSRVKVTAERFLPGILEHDVKVEFVVAGS